MTKGYKIALSDDAIQRINHCREYLDKKMEDVAHPIYGVTTGFGSLCNISISKEHLSQLQQITTRKACHITHLGLVDDAAFANLLHHIFQTL